MDVSIGSSFSFSVQVWKRKFQRNWRDHGFWIILGKGLARLAGLVYTKTDYRLYQINLHEVKKQFSSAVDEIEFRFLEVGDDAGIERVEELAEWLLGTVQQRLRKGGLCLGAFSNGTLIAFNLVAFGKAYMPLVRIHRKFRKDEAWSEQVVVDENFRQRGLASELRCRIIAELRQRGIRKLYGGALADNLPSLKLARRLGFHEFVKVRYRRILGLPSRRLVRPHARPAKDSAGEL